jgi:hypothetical protein
MCKEQILAQGKVAIIFKASGCDCINLTLSNLNLHLKYPDFMDFTNYINHINQSLPTSLHIQIDTPYEGVTLFFRVLEFQELCKLLNRAILTLELVQVSFKSSFSLN